MKARHKRFTFIILGLISVSIAAFLVLKAFNQNLVFFYTPTQVAKGEVPQKINFRIGGLVKVGSLVRSDQNLDIRFVITDTVNETKVLYSGALPDLFKEGKGVVAEGQILKDGSFYAKTILAKHDENYMPPEAAEALKRAKNPR